MGSDESHFNVSVGSDGQSHGTVSTNHNLFEEKGEPKRYRTEVLPLTNLMPYLTVSDLLGGGVGGGGGGRRGGGREGNVVWSINIFRLHVFGLY